MDAGITGILSKILMYFSIILSKDVELRQIVLKKMD